MSQIFLFLDMLLNIYLKVKSIKGQESKNWRGSCWYCELLTTLLILYKHYLFL